MMNFLEHLINREKSVQKSDQVSLYWKRWIFAIISYVVIKNYIFIKKILCHLKQWA